MNKFITIGLAILGIIALITIAPFLVKSAAVIANPTAEGVQEVAEEGTKAIVNVSIPWWVWLLEMGSVGVFIVVILFIVAPRLMNG